LAHKTDGIKHVRVERESQSQSYLVIPTDYPLLPPICDTNKVF